MLLSLLCSSLIFFETGPRRGFVGTRRGREGLSRDRNESEIFFAGEERGERKMESVERKIKVIENKILSIAFILNL